MKKSKNETLEKLQKEIEKLENQNQKKKIILKSLYEKLREL